MAEAIVSIVVGRLTDLLSEDTQLLDGVSNQIEQVVIKLRWIKTFLRDADSRIREEKIRILLAEVRQLAYNAEHCVESFIVKAGTTMQWMNRTKFSRKIKDIQKKMSFLSTCFGEYNIRSTLDFPEQLNPSCRTAETLKRFNSYTIVEPEIFVAFQGDVDRLVGHLVNESDDCYSVISICGMGGLGKTTLTQKIYNHSTIKAYFSGLAWVSISRKWQVEHVLKRILICLEPEKKEEILAYDDGKVVENLLQVQRTRKCLIVLDDIWSTNAWDSLRVAFTDEKSVSRLMLTSRKVDVAKHVNPNGLIHQPKSLSAEQSWDLLKLKALPRGYYQDITRDVERMEGLGREMVAFCFGLPLAIVILGGILVTKPTLTEWEKVYYDSLPQLNRGKGFGKDYERELFEVLVWSYNDLPPQLKPCFLYLGKFREDEWIKTGTLNQLWIAEGMVLSSDKREGETMMQVAESYLGELVLRNMVQVRTNDTESLPIKFESCSLHDLMRDLSLSQAKVECFFEVTDLEEGNHFHNNFSTDLRSAYSRQLVMYFDKGNISKKFDPYFVKKANQYRSMLLFTKFGTKGLPLVLGSHVASFRFLRVFSMENVRTVSATLFRINLGRALGSLVYLRYLSVRNTQLLMFPSIQKLVLLETLKLDILDRVSSIYFPPWRSRNILEQLRHLRHLYLPSWEVHSLGKNLKLRFNGLSKLETLVNFNTKWCEVKDLPILISLRRLKLVVEGFYEVEELMKYLAAIALSSSSCLWFLSLALSTHGLRSFTGPDFLRQVLQDRNLHLYELIIHGELPELAELFEQQQLQNTRITDVTFSRITILKLAWSGLYEDPMPVLEKLPSLSNLGFLGTYMGKEMVCSATGFPKLTVLKLYHLSNLVKWRVEKGSMPILNTLAISKCPELEELPEGLRFLDSFRFLTLTKMPSDFCRRLQVINGEPGPDLHKVAQARIHMSP